MLGWILPTGDNGRFLIMAFDRSIVFMDSTGLDIAEWLEGNPGITEIVNPEPESIQELLMLRIMQHRGRSAAITIPSYQQTAFETPSQTLGMGGTLISAVILRLLLRRIFSSSIPSPNHLEPGRFTECTTSDALEIAALSHRFIAGRINGRALTGANF